MTSKDFHPIVTALVSTIQLVTSNVHSRGGTIWKSHSKQFYEVIISHKIWTKNCKDFCPELCHTTIFRSKVFFIKETSNIMICTFCQTLHWGYSCFEKISLLCQNTSCARWSHRIHKMRAILSSKYVCTHQLFSEK